MNRREITAGTLAIGRIPRIVGTVSTIEALERLGNDTVAPCDLIEVRFDLIGSDLAAVVGCCLRVESRGMPIIFTVRQQAEGGQWTGDEEARKEIFLRALPAVSLIDIEMASTLFPVFADMVRQFSKSLIVSYHDFHATPDFSALSAMIERISASGPAIAKIATTAKSSDDLDVLRRLLDTDWEYPLCVIGMGFMGAESRVSFPAMGSCLTYGYIDTPVAPGQLSSAVLVDRLRAASNTYNDDFLVRRPHRKSEI